MRLLYIDCPYGLDERRLLAALDGAGADLTAARDSALKTGLEIPHASTEPASRGGVSGLRLLEVARPAAVLPALPREHPALTGPRRALWEKTMDRLETAGLLAAASVPPSDLVPDLPLLALLTAALEQLAVDEISASPLGIPRSPAVPGELALPGPLGRLAVGVEIYGRDGHAVVTPGALALLSAAVSRYGALPALRLTSSGWGIGDSRGPDPDVVQVYLGDRPAVAEAARIRVLETNIDDMSPQVLDHVMGLLLERGALDVFFTPIQMKKNRPAVLVTVLCREREANACAAILFRETTTLGIRFSEAERSCLERRSFEVDTPFGTVPVKAAYFEGRLRSVTPEYDVCHRLALAAGVPLREVQDAAVRSAASSPTDS